MKSSVPKYAMICIVAMIAAAVMLLLLSNPTTTPSLPLVIGLIVTTVPSLVAALFSERASRDIRNGVVVEKVREGATLAIQEAHIQTAPIVTASLAALTKLLEANTTATQINTNAQQSSHHEQDYAKS